MNAKILWVDDEIDLLKPHIIFLEQKDYSVDTAVSGNEALDMIEEADYDIVFLDENMPGLSGIETLERMKIKFPSVPVVMITKSEEESIMEEAIGSNIADYLIKPVKPNQILLCLKKNLETKKLVSEKTTSAYQQEFQKLSMEISDDLNFNEWTDVYKKLVGWELSLGKSKKSGMEEVLKMQKDEANQQFTRFVMNNYESWVNAEEDKRPIQSHTLMKKKVFPVLEDKKPTFLFLIDNLRWDQWKSIQPFFEDSFKLVEEELFYSILPTTTQYSRNSLFSGLMPSEIQKKYPQYWMGEMEEGSKNQFESELLGELLKRFGKDTKYSYHKVLNMSFGRKVVNSLPNLMNNDLNVIVYNFVDMLSHARTEMEIIKELADDEAAYRSLTVSWFEHSPLYEMIQYLGDKDVNLLITTDHGSIRVDNPVQIIGDKNTNTNLRYKVGRSLNYKAKEVFEARSPEKLFLPKYQMNDGFVFAKTNDFLAYRNNFNHYAKYYKNTFQHGGLSMEEMLIPFISMRRK
ncbi:MAG: PglZ domain-containing protein [Bacteroidales bacterium]|nr:PglZ domain-containing protein [Bacteroidales bacterium]